MKAMLGLLVLSFPLLSAADVVVPIDSVENYVNIRQAPEAGTDIVGRLQQGIPLPLVQSVPGWHEVTLDDEGTTGFVSADWSQVVVEEAESAAEGVVAEVIEEADPPSEPEPAEKQVVAEVVEPEPEVEPVVEPAPEAEPEPAPEPEAVVEEVPEPEAAPEPVVDVEPAAEPSAPPTVIQGPIGPPGPAGPPGAATIEGKPGFLVKFKEETIGAGSQIFDDGNQVGIGTTEPKQRLEVNGSIQIHEQNSSVAGLMITQSSGETGYIMHNRASTLTIGAGSQDRMTIDRNGNVGIGVTRPEHPLQMASGAYVSAGGVWTNSSSRARKENIADLSVEDALATLAQLQPVQYNYKNDSSESYIGFIAEDVPELVATGDRQGLSAMDIVAVLTRVIQAQQQQIEELEAKLDD